jgi:protein SCO1
VSKVVPTSNHSAAAPASRTPLDLKLFYSFVTVLAVGMVGLLVLWRPSKNITTPRAPDQPRRLEAFRLTDQAGRTFTQAEVAGKYAVVNFIHTSCSISCLEVNRQMAEVQRLTAGQDDVLLLSLTVDPRTDTPPVLAEFGEKFGADSNRWHLLTGEKAALYQLIETSFLKREPFARTSPMPGGFLDVDHIAVVDRAGNVRRYFEGMRTTTPAAIVKLLVELKAEKKSP